MPCLLPTGRPVPHFHLLGWLARCRAVELTEVANRLSNGGELKLSPHPLSVHSYASARRQLEGSFGVGLDRNVARGDGVAAAGAATS